MSELKDNPIADNGASPDARGNRPLNIFRRIYTVLSSVKLAMTLLIAILACCVVGVTVLRGDRAWTMIFNTLWFNGLLVLLVANVGFCFFGRIWGRKVTIISLGMILFHLSFVVMLAGIVYNSLFYFRGAIRLTEGEALPSGQPQSYDSVSKGRFFDYSALKGQTKLVKMYSAYKVEGTDKRAAYEIAVGEGSLKKQGVIYITHNLEYKGFRYFNDREGYSLLIILHDKEGREIYGAFVPLQSLKQKDNSYLYVTGTRHGPGDFPFPQHPEKPLFDLQVAYRPDTNNERAGDAFFQVRPSAGPDATHPADILAEGKAPIGGKFRAGDYYLSAMEVRYWVSMNVHYEPGQPIVLATLWVCLGGMVITFIGRIRKRRVEGKAS